LLAADWELRARRVGGPEGMKPGRQRMWFPKFSIAERLLYFCDESHIRQSDYVGVGGLAVRPERAAKMARDLAGIRAECRFSGTEVKWENCKKRRLNIHEAYANYLFDAIERGHIHLHVRLSPFKEYDHAASGDRRETDTISKSYYQLIVHRAGRYYAKSCRLLIRPDDGECTSYLPTMKEGMNSEIMLRYGVLYPPIADVAPCSSRTEPMLHLLDIVLGALTAARNGNVEDGKLAAPKLALARLILKRARIDDITGSDYVERRDFNLWNVVPKWKKGAIPTR